MGENEFSIEITRSCMEKVYFRNSDAMVSIRSIDQTNFVPSERTKLIENCGFGKISSSVQYVKRYRFCSHYEKQNLLSTEFDYNLKTY